MNPDAANMSPLADVDGVHLLTRKPVRAIYAMADGGDLVEGKYVWVWNVATNPQGKIRDLRFWIGEVLAPKRQSALTLAQVIDFILPRNRREFPSGEVQGLLQVRHNTLLELRAELNGALRAGSNFYPRAALVEFFHRRWLGACGTATKQFHPANAEERDNGMGTNSGSNPGPRTRHSLKARNGARSQDGLNLP